MISPVFFHGLLESLGCGFYAGVPDSLLKGLCFHLESALPPERFVIAANEGGAMGLAAGWHLGTGGIPAVFLQNSGLGNAVNPLLSLFDPEVCRIPCLLIVGWRGEPGGGPDEPQHAAQGRLTLPLLRTLGVEYAVLPGEEASARETVESAFARMRAEKSVFALVVKKGTFEETSSVRYPPPSEGELPMTREEAVRRTAEALPPGTAVVSTTGMISRELFECRGTAEADHGLDFLNTGAMGHASQIALGLALARPEKTVCCFDGDGSLLMHLGGMALTGAEKPRNLIHIVFNNGAHDSVGGFPTAGFRADFRRIALACGFASAFSASSPETLAEILGRLNSLPRPLFLEIRVRCGHRPGLGRPSISPRRNLELFLRTLGSGGSFFPG